jgi:hypothetical protein
MHNGVQIGRFTKGLEKIRKQKRQRRLYPFLGVKTFFFRDIITNKKCGNLIGRLKRTVKTIEQEIYAKEGE